MILWLISLYSNISFFFPTFFSPLFFLKLPICYDNFFSVYCFISFNFALFFFTHCFNDRFIIAHFLFLFPFYLSSHFFDFYFLFYSDFKPFFLSFFLFPRMGLIDLFKNYLNSIGLYAKKPTSICTKYVNMSVQ